MDVTFGDERLRQLEDDPAARTTLDSKIVRAYRRLLRYIRDATDERDLRAWPGKRLEKLRGDRAGQYSMRIDGQFRLIFEIRQSRPKNTIHIVEIVDYH